MVRFLKVYVASVFQEAIHEARDLLDDILGYIILIRNLIFVV